MKKEKQNNSEELLKQELLQLSIAGLSTREIAERTQLSKTTVARILKKLSQTSEEPNVQDDEGDSHAKSPADDGMTDNNAIAGTCKDSQGVSIQFISSKATQVLLSTIEQLQRIINAETDTAKLARAMTELTATIEKLDTLQKKLSIAIPQDCMQETVREKTAFDNDFEKRHIAFTSGKPS